MNRKLLKESNDDIGYYTFNVKDDKFTAKLFAHPTMGDDALKIIKLLESLEEEKPSLN